LKQWIKKAKEYLSQSQDKVAQALNELDWKENLFPMNAKLCHHICAFANLPGGSYLVFGIDSKSSEVKSSRQGRSRAYFARLNPVLYW
jgi:ATP-dependent DNA helicase RecG